MSKRLPGSKMKNIAETCMMLDHNNRFQPFDKLLEGYNSV